jgi:hypothetical protein
MNDSAERQVLVVYYSLTGNTARVARDLAVRLNGDVESIQDGGHGTGFLGQLAAAFHALRKTPARIGTIQRDPTRYAITVVGTPVWSWQMTPAVRAYLQNTRGKIRNVAFFITSGDTDVARIAPSLEALAGRKAVASAGFNARELADAGTYQRKVSAFVDAITRATA